MKHTSPIALVVLALVGGVIGALLESALTSMGRPVMLPPITLAIALAVIGVILIVLALPIRRATKDQSKPNIDPFYATRVLVLAKASALSGALITGFGIGALAYLLTRTVVGVGSVAQVVAAIVGAAMLLAAGLVAEYMCKVPPADDDDDDHPGKQPVHVQP